MREYYRHHSIKIITGILAIVLIGMYVGLSFFTQSAHVLNPVYTRPFIEKIEISNFIGTIEMNTSDIEGFRLEYSNKKPDDYKRFYPLFKMGTPTIATIDGRRKKSQDCTLKIDEDNALISATIIETDSLKSDIKQYPILKITAKNDLIIDIKNSNIFGVIGNIKAIKIHQSKCSFLNIGLVAETVTLDINQKVGLHIGDIAGDLTLKANQENVFVLQNIGGNANINFRGFNRFYAAEINGELTLNENESIIRINNVNGNSVARN